MTNKKTTRQALLLSVLSLLLCASMLVGTTFAWFTDSVSSLNNRIISGNLDIELEYSKDFSAWNTVDGASDLFSTELWEPGHTEVVYLRLTNKGNLALKYLFNMNFTEEAGTNMAGETFKLSEYLKYDIVDVTAAYVNRDAARAAVESTAQTLTTYAANGEMYAQNESKTIALVVYMPEEVGNEANHKTGTPAPSINLGITLFATQMTNEKDSFGSDYDKGAAWTGGANTNWYFDDPTASEFTISSAEELAGLSALVNGTAVAPTTTLAATSAATVQDSFKGKTIYIGGNINLNNINWTPIGDDAHPFLGNFDGQNHIISNLKVTNGGWAGLIGHAGKSAGSTIKNVKIDGAVISSNRMTGTVVGQLYGSIDNCHVNDASIIVVPNAVSGGFDNGDKVGGIVGWLGDNNNYNSLTNCSVKNSTLGAYRDIGGIAGYVAYSTTISGNSVSDTAITVDQTTNYYGDKDHNAGAIWGRNSVSTGGVGVTASNNTDSNVSINITYSKNGLTLKKDGMTGDVVLYLVPDTYTSDTVNVPEGVTSIGNYAFAYNSNVKTVNLASTVRDLGRGFDSSSVEKVVLNEGLTTVSNRAFRRTYELKEVVFSSTVTTLAENAFQSSGIKNIVFPANVTSIGDSCFTAASVENVTVEGNNVHFAHYAFRDCPNLKTVTILSDTITLGDGMIFTNSQNNNEKPNNITIYVMNEGVKNTIEANGTFNGTIVMMNAVSTSEELVNAINNASDGDKIYLNPGSYSLRFTNNTSFNADNLTFVGISGVTMSVSSSEVWYGRVQGSNVTFENITFTGSVGATGKATYNNCTMDTLICASSNYEETFINECNVGFLNTSTDFSSGDTYVNGSAITKAEYSGSKTMYFENCTIDELISWNMNTVLTGCNVTALDASHMTSNTIVADGVIVTA